MIKRTPEKTTQLSVAQYQGQARPGEVVIDESTYQMYVANATGDLNLVGTGAANLNTTQIVNGVSNIAIPLAGANIHVGVSGVANVVNFGQTQVDFKANIVPVGDAVYSLGGPTNQFKDLWLSNSTLYMNLIPISVRGNILTVGNANVLTDNGSGTATFTGNVVAAGNLLAGNITTPGNVATGNLSVSNQLIACVSVTTDSIISRTGSLTFTAVGTNQNVTLRPSGNGVVSVDSSRITNIDQPVDANDAATKAYVDAVLSGLIVHQSVAAATTGPLSGSYSPGIGGVGATFTLTVPSNFLDGYALQAGDRILIKDQLTPYENGVYIRSTTSVFTRATDFDTTTDFDRAFVFVSNGTVNNRTGWVQTGPVVTVGGSSVVFYQYSAASNYTPGTGLTMVGSQFRLADTTVTAGVYGNATTIPSITVDAQGRLIGVANVAVDRNGANITGTSLNSNVLTSNLTQLGVLTSLNVGGVSNLGAVGNVIILGGTNGQVLTTNGAGNLAWSPFPIASNIANGVSNVNIPIGGGNIVVTAGTVNSANITASGIVAANLTSNGNVTTSNLSVANKSNLGSVSNVTITGGFAGYVLTTDGAGVLTWGPGGGGSGYAIANGSSNVTISTINGNVKFGVNGTADVLIVSDLGANITGLLGATDALITGNLTVAGNVNYINVDSLQVVDPVISLGGGANGIPLTVNDGKDRGTLLNYYTTQQVRAFMGWDNSAGEFAFGSNVSNVNDVMTFNALGNVRASTFIGNLAGQTLALTGTSNLNQIANVTILGGTSGQVMTTDGFGTLTWTTPATGTPNSIANGTTTVTIPTASDAIIFTSNGVQIANMWSDTTIKTSTFTGTIAMDATDGNVDFTNSRTTTLGPVGNIKITGGTVGQILTATGVAGGIQWSNPSAGSIIANGFSNITIPASSGNITHNVAGVKIIDANVDTITVQNGVNLVMGSGTADFSAVTKTNLGAPSQITITGGTSGQVLTTDGAGVLSWTSGGSGGLSNGTSNVSIPLVNDTVYVYANGQLVADFYGDSTGGTTTTISGNFVVKGIAATGSNNVWFGDAANPIDYVHMDYVGALRIPGIANISIGGGASGYLLATNGGGGLYWSSGTSQVANGTSNITIPTVNDSISINTNGGLRMVFGADGNNSLYSNIVAAGSYTMDLGTTASPFARFSIGNSSVFNVPTIANWTMTGANGTAGQILTTYGNGKLYWSTVTGGTGISNGTSNVTIPTASSDVLIYSNGQPLATFNATASGRTTLLSGNLKLVASNPGDVIQFGQSGSDYSIADFANVGNVTLGPVANVHITGGTSGQVLTTDGTGVLSWTSVSGGSGLSNGTSNINIPATDGPIDTYVASIQVSRATASQLIMYGQNIVPSANVTGNIGSSSQYWATVFGYDANIANLARVTNITPFSGGDVTIIGANLLPDGNKVCNLGSPTQRWNSLYVANNTIYLGDSALSITSGNLTVDGNTVVVQSTTGGNTVIEGNIVAPGDITSNGNVVAGNLITAGTLDVSGSANLGLVGNITILGGSNGQVLTTNGNGSLSWTTVGGGGGSGNLIYGTIPNIANANIVATTFGASYDPGDGSTLNYYSFNVNFTNPANVTSTGIISVGAAQSVANGPYYRSIGTDTHNINFYAANSDGGPGEIYMTGETRIVLNGPNVAFNGGPAGITMGTANAGEVLGYDDTNGRLKWVTVGGGNGGGTSISNGNSSVNTYGTGIGAGVTIAANNFVSVQFTSNADGSNRVANFYGTLTVANAGAGMPGGVNFTAAANVSLGAVGNVKITGGSNGQVLTTDGSGGLSWTTVSGGGGGGSSISNANTSISTYVDSFVMNADNFTILSGYGNALNSPSGAVGVVFGGWKYDMFSGARWNFSNASNVTLSSIGNLHILGGTSGQVLSTDGSGGLSWTTVSGGGTPTSIANGSSTVGFDGANGNIILNAGSSSFSFYTDGTIVLPSTGNTRANISGTITEVRGNPYPSSGSGSVVVWTATNSPVGAKMVLRAQHSDGNIQMMEIMMAKQGSTVVHTVSNRIKTNSGATDIDISVALSSGNLQVTAACGASTYKFTHSVTQFGESA